MSSYQYGSALISEAGLLQDACPSATADAMAPLSRYMDEPSPVLARLPIVVDDLQPIGPTAGNRLPRALANKRSAATFMAGVGVVILLMAIAYPLLTGSGEKADPQSGLPSWAPPPPAPTAAEAPAWKPAAVKPSKPALVAPAATPKESSPPAAKKPSPTPQAASNWPPVQTARTSAKRFPASERPAAPIAAEQPPQQVASTPAPTVQNAWPGLSTTRSASTPGPVRITNPTVTAQAAVVPRANAPMALATPEPLSCPWPRPESSVAEMASRPAPVACPENPPRYDGRYPQAPVERSAAAGQTPSATSREELYRAYYAQRYGTNYGSSSRVNQPVGAGPSNPAPASATQSPPPAQPTESTEPGVARFEGTIEKPTTRTRH